MPVYERFRVAPIPPATAQPGKNQQVGKPARGKRSPLPAELKRLDILHDVPEAERTCACGTPMVEIGQDVSEQLDIVPMQIRVLRHIRKRYGCACSMHAPVTAALPPQPLPKSNASADFLAMLLTVKFVDGLPLARFEYVLDRHGVPVPRQTLARWVIGAARMLQPLHNLISRCRLPQSNPPPDGATADKNGPSHKSKAVAVSSSSFCSVEKREVAERRPYAMLSGTLLDSET